MLLSVCDRSFVCMGADVEWQVLMLQKKDSRCFTKRQRVFFNTKQEILVWHISYNAQNWFPKAHSVKVQKTNPDKAPFNWKTTSSTPNYKPVGRHERSGVYRPLFVITHGECDK